MITKVSIPGIHCPSCAALIKDVSSDFPSIETVDVNIDSKIVTIHHNNDFSIQKWSEEIEALDPTYGIHPLS